MLFGPTLTFHHMEFRLIILSLYYHIHHCFSLCRNKFRDMLQSPSTLLYGWTCHFVISPVFLSYSNCFSSGLYRPIYLYFPGVQPAFGFRILPMALWMTNPLPFFFAIQYIFVRFFCACCNGNFNFTLLSWSQAFIMSSICIFFVRNISFFLIKCGISLKVDVKWKCYFLMSAFQNTYRSLFVTLRGCTLNQFIFRFVCRSSLHGHQHCSIVSSVSYNFVGEYKSEIVFFFYCAHHSSPSSKYSSKPRLQQRSGHEGKHTSDSVQLLGQTIRTTTTAVGWVKVQNQRFYFFFALTYLPHLMSEL